MTNSNSNRATTSNINKGWSALEAAAESAATLVTVVGLLKKLFWEQFAQRRQRETETQVKQIDDWGVTSCGGDKRRRGLISGLHFVAQLSSATWCSEAKNLKLLQLG